MSFLRVRKLPVTVGVGGLKFIYIRGPRKADAFWGRGKTTEHWEGSLAENLTVAELILTRSKVGGFLAEKKGSGKLSEQGVTADVEDAGKSATKTAVNKSAKKKRTKSAKTGVPKKKDKYHRIVRDKLTLIIHWKRMGWTDEEVAKRLGIAYSTFKVYKGKYEELSAALRAGADEANAEVENALFGRAVGMKTTVKKPMKVKTVEYENGKRVREEERIEYGEEEVFVPPDVTADMFYLKNRMPDRWGEKKPQDDDERRTGVIFIPGVE